MPKYNFLPTAKNITVYAVNDITKKPTALFSKQWVKFFDACEKNCLIIAVADKIIGADVKEHRKIVYYRCVWLCNAGFPVRNRTLTCADCFCKFGLRNAFLCP